MTISAIHGTKGRFYFHGLDMSPYVESIDFSLDRSRAEHKPLAGGYVNIALGISSLTITLGGAAMTQGEGSIEEQMWEAMQNDEGHCFSYLPFGDYRTALAFCGISKYANHSMTAGDDVLRMPVGVVGSHQVDKCKVIVPLGITGISPSIYVDEGALSSKGGAAYLHVTSISSGAALAVAVRDSYDHLTFSDLAVFGEVTQDNISELGSQRVLVEGDINRYLRAEWVLTGEDAEASWFVSFGRRQ